MVRCVVWDFTSQQLSNLCSFESESDQAHGCLKVHQGGDVTCVFSLLLIHNDQPAVPTMGTLKSQTLRPYICIAKVCNGLFTVEVEASNSADQHAAWEIPPIAQHQQTKVLYKIWSVAHTTALKCWILFHLLRVAGLRDDFRSKAVTYSRQNAHCFERDFATSLQQLELELNGQRQDDNKDNKHKLKRDPFTKQRCTDLFKVYRIVSHQDTSVMFPRSPPTQPCVHHVACVVCNRDPIPDRVFVCDTCDEKTCTFCKDCFVFHDPTHTLSVIGADPTAFPPRRAPALPVQAASCVMQRAPHAVEPAPAAEAAGAPSSSEPAAVEAPDRESDSDEKEDVIYTIEAIRRGRTYKGQRQYYIKYAGTQCPSWVTFEELTVLSPIDGGFGKWKHAAPYDTAAYMLQVLQDIPTPLENPRQSRPSTYRASPGQRKRKKSTSNKATSEASAPPPQPRASSDTDKALQIAQAQEPDHAAKEEEGKYEPEAVSRGSDPQL